MKFTFLFSVVGLLVASGIACAIGLQYSVDAIGGFLIAVFLGAIFPRAGFYLGRAVDLKLSRAPAAEQNQELKRLGIRLTPYHLPDGTDQDRAMAWELFSRYVTGAGAIGTAQFGGDCIALGRHLEHGKSWWRRLFKR